MDYIFRWLDLRFGQKADTPLMDTAETVAEVPSVTDATQASNNGGQSNLEQAVFTSQADAPPCTGCGSIMVRSGACYKCFNCGATSGCS